MEPKLLAAAQLSEGLEGIHSALHRGACHRNNSKRLTSLQAQQLQSTGHRFRLQTTVGIGGQGAKTIGRKPHHRSGLAEGDMGG